MHTARSLTVSPSILCSRGWGACLVPGGACLVLGVLAWFQGGAWLRWGCLPGPGGGWLPAWSQGGNAQSWGGCTCLVPGECACLVRGVPGLGGMPAWSWGCLPSLGGGCLPGPGVAGYGIPSCTEADPPLWTEWQTTVKILPCPNFVAGGNYNL